MCEILKVPVKVVEMAKNGLEIAVDYVRSATRSDVDDAFKLGAYKIKKPSGTSLERWKTEIDKTLDVLKNGEVEGLAELVMRNNGSYFADVNSLKKMLKENSFSAEDLTLLAISLFLLRHKSPWGKGNIRTKVLAGETVKMEDLLTEEGRTNCFDGAVIVRELARLYGIDGDVRVSTPFLHGFFESKNGKVVDSFYGWKVFGLFKTRKEFDEYLERMSLSDKLGLNLKFLKGKSK